MDGLILFMACLLVIHHVQIIRLLRHLCDNTSYLERFKASHLQWRQRIVRGRIWNGVDLDTVLKPPPLIRQLYFCSRRGRGNKENLTTWLIKEKNEPFVVAWVGWLCSECVWVIRLLRPAGWTLGPSNLLTHEGRCMVFCTNLLRA